MGSNAKIDALELSSKPEARYHVSTSSFGEAETRAVPRGVWVLQKATITNWSHWRAGEVAETCCWTELSFALSLKHWATVAGAPQFKGHHLPAGVPGCSSIQPYISNILYFLAIFILRKVEPGERYIKSSKKLASFSPHTEESSWPERHFSPPSNSLHGCYKQYKYGPG